jgi:hypothetical protein
MTFPLSTAANSSRRLGKSREFSRYRNRIRNACGQDTRLCLLLSRPLHVVQVACGLESPNTASASTQEPGALHVADPGVDPDHRPAKKARPSSEATRENVLKHYLLGCVVVLRVVLARFEAGPLLDPLPSRPARSSLLFKHSEAIRRLLGSRSAQHIWRKSFKVARARAP